MAGQRETANFTLDDKAFVKALNEAMKRLGISSERELLQLGNDVRNRAVRYTPVDTGRLRQGWHIDHGTDARGPWVDVRNSTNYAWFVEYGTGPHVIEAKNAKVLMNKRTGQVFGKRVMHPGSPAQPMIRPALLEAATSWRPRITP